MVYYPLSDFFFFIFQFLLFIEGSPGKLAELSFVVIITGEGKKPQPLFRMFPEAVILQTSCFYRLR